MIEKLKELIATMNNKKRSATDVLNAEYHLARAVPKLVRFIDDYDRIELFMEESDITAERIMRLMQELKRSRDKLAKEKMRT